MAATIAATFYCLYLFNAPQRFFTDADGGWHIRAGEIMLDSGAVLRSDPFSFLQTGKPWYAWEWGAEILMALLHRADGLTAVVFFYLMVIAVTIWCWFRLHWKLGGNLLLACAMASPLVSSLQIHWLARPHLISHLFLLSAILVMEAAPSRFRAWHGGAAALAAALWAAIHGSFFIGLLLPWLYAGGYLAAAWRIGDDAAGERRRKANWYIAVGLCALAGSMLNPYGLQLHKHVLDFLLQPELRGDFEESVPYDFNRPNGFQLVLTIAISALGGLLALRQKRIHHALVAALFVLLALGAARAVPLCALVGLPLANASITEWLERFRNRWPSWAEFSAQLRELDAGLNGVALAPFLALLALIWLQSEEGRRRTGFPEEKFPVFAHQAIAALPAEARLFASPLDGGYISYVFSGRRKIWVDARSDYFGPEPYRFFKSIIHARAGWQQRLRQAGFTHVLIDRRYRVAEQLERAGYPRLYQDSRVSLYQVP